MPGIQDAVQTIIVDVINKANGVCYYPLALSNAMMLR